MSDRGTAARGFTLVEMLISLVVLGIVGFSMVNLFRFQHRASVRQNEGVRATQNARAGLDMLARDLKNAGYDPLGTAGATIVTAEPDTVSWTADLNGDGDVSDFGASGDEAVTYFFQADSNAVVREVQGVRARVADGVTSLTFTFLDGDGNPVTDPADAEQAEVRIQYETPDGVETGDIRTQVALRNEKYKDAVAAAVAGGGGGGTLPDPPELPEPPELP